MFSHSNYTIFMISMRVGTQGILIYFKVFKGKGDAAFKEKIIINGISFVSKLFNGKYELIFTAKRWFNVVHKDVYITKHRLKTNIVVSNSINTSTPWIIATNKDIEHAVCNYSYRFSTIECLFKNQKSNGFYLEKFLMHL